MAPANAKAVPRRPRQPYNRSQGVRSVEYVQQLRYIKMESFKSVIIDRVNSNQILQYAYITHDKDKTAEGELVEPHIHCMMKFRNCTRLSAIKSWFNCQENNLEKLKGSWQTALRYLTHMNSPEKHQYSPQEVTANFNYAEEVEIRVGSRPKRTTLPIETKEKLDRIDEGEITEKNWFLHFTSEEYSKHKEKIRRYLDIANCREEFVNLNDKRRLSDNIYIYGRSGLGKTRLAKRICTTNYNEFFMSGSGSDPLDGYKGEAAIIFDDIRPEDMTLAEYLKLTDPHNCTPIKSRYKNVVNKAKQICMTTPHHPRIFCQRLQQGNSSEEPKQFFRRHHTYIEVNEKVFRLYSYDANKDVLIMYDEQDNIYESRATGCNVTQLDQQKKLSSLLRRFAEEGESDYESTMCDTNASSCAKSVTESDVIQECHHVDTPSTSQLTTRHIVK